MPAGTTITTDADDEKGASDVLHRRSLYSDHPQSVNQVLRRLVHVAANIILNVSVVLSPPDRAQVKAPVARLARHLTAGVVVVGSRKEGVRTSSSSGSGLIFISPWSVIDEEIRVPGEGHAGFARSAEEIRRKKIQGKEDERA
jgi:hypothetical protein